MPDASNWKENGIRIVRAGQLDTNTTQTPGMTRAAAITHQSAGASALWAGTMLVEPGHESSAHHHGEMETILYVTRGRVRILWGDQLEYSAEAGPGDFLFVPPHVPHREINPSKDEPAEAIVVRNGQEPIVVGVHVNH
ncbi:MAG: cupin domain-containing protein [Bryobacteraceae bacterium]